MSLNIQSAEPPSDIAATRLTKSPAVRPPVPEQPDSSSKFIKALKATLGVVVFPLSYGISKAALPSSFFNALCSKNERDQLRQELIASKGTECERLSLQTQDGAVLDAMAIYQNSESQEQNPADQKWIILFNPNGMTYEENLHFAHDYGQKVGANVLVFNYRGVGDSTGHPTCGEDLVQDGLRCVQHLNQERGVRAENILIHGHSIGGGIGTQVAARYSPQESTQGSSQGKVKLISDRSFSSMQAAATEITAEKTNALMGKIVGQLFKVFGWEINAEQSWGEVENENKARVFHVADKMILPEASLHIRLHNKRREEGSPPRTENIVQLSAGKRISQADREASIELMEDLATTLRPTFKTLQGTENKELKDKFKELGERRAEAESLDDLALLQLFRDYSEACHQLDIFIVQNRDTFTPEELRNLNKDSAQRQEILGRMRNKLQPKDPNYHMYSLSQNQADFQAVSSVAQKLLGITPAPEKASAESSAEVSPDLA